MLDDIAGTYGSRLFIAAGGVAVALLVLVGVLWLVRNRAPSPFVRGGKGRQQRLQVLDAAAIDARRRIVLIRRDGVEHLVMIGGPTDIVIESGIGDTSKMQAIAPAPAPPVETLSTREPVREQLTASAEPAPLVGRRREPAALSSPPTPPAVSARPAVAEPAPVAAPEPRPQIAPPVAPEVEAAAVAPEERNVAPVVAAAPAKSLEPVLFERQAEAEAADILDAARSRVLPPVADRSPVSERAAVPERPPLSRPVAPREVDAPPAAPILVQDAYSESFDLPVPDVAQPRKLGSDFETVLEAEMANTLTAERVVAPTPQAARPEPTPRAEPVAPQRRDPDMAPITGGDVALQKEVARIFGEMSVNREK